MASAILTSRNDSRSSDYMSKFSNNRNLNFMRVHNISNPIPSSSNFFFGNTGRDVIQRNHQQFPQFSQAVQRNHEQCPQAIPRNKQQFPQAAQAAFSTSLLNSVPANSNSYGYRYITFRISSYTRTELIQLKKRLVSDLQRVRMIQQWIYFKTTQKMNYHPQELKLPAAVGRKRTNPLPLVRETKKQCGRRKNMQKRKLMMKKCEQILAKLMQHKHGWVFNTPVDAAALKLYDYHNIIHNPMDLGTIKSKLARNKYVSPLAFASDVRLTFQNALVYNGGGSAVYIMAERLLLLFEELFKVNSMHLTHEKRVVNQVKMENLSSSAQVLIEKPVVSDVAVARVLKKPEMTDEEKAELAESFCNLQLGPEGMNQIMAIVKKGVLELEHQGDEVEVDLAVLDNDTLWTLRDFIERSRNEYAGNECLVVEEEDVDIGEEMQLTVFPSVEIEKDAVNVSSSESSSDSDSSSSDNSGSGDSCNEQEVNSSTQHQRWLHD